ncbi:plasmid pRiA4b ORF-3 family protein [Thermodesulfovibrio hydrogeniphilus]
MKKSYEFVYQFKITLLGIKPPIWRRIQVPENYSFWDLHVAIQDAMGRTDTHLHMFLIKDPKTGGAMKIGISDNDFSFKPILAGWKQKIKKLFSPYNIIATYIYDFGDNWHHQIKLEKILPRKEGIKYPICIAGKRACPPEDCGGPYGYLELLEAINDPNHERHEELLEWVGGIFDPEHFDPKEVFFDNPKERKQMLFDNF